MRTDEELAKSFRRSKAWQTDAFSGAEAPELDRRVQDGGRVQEGKFLTHSHSGHERNHLFLSRAGKEFTDLSTVSGLDSIADSRGFVLWDYDRDGWQDIALVNANAPLLNMYRNQIGSLPESPTAPFIVLRIVGGNRTADPSSTYGPRDGYGVKVSVSLPDRTIYREHRCGEGFAVQNSNKMIIGIGSHDQVDAVEVFWPSGQSQSIGAVAAGTLLTVYENPADAADARGYSEQPYVVARSGLATGPKSSQNKPTIVLFGAAADVGTTGNPQQLRMYTTMATWCEACKRLQPQLEHLRGCYSTDELIMYGVPVDEADTRDKLQTYMSTYQPPYHLLSELTTQERTRFQNLLDAGDATPALPSTVITDGRGKVLHMSAGIPTASDFGRLRMMADEAAGGRLRQ